MSLDTHVFFLAGDASGLGAATVRMLAAADGQLAIAATNQAVGGVLVAELDPTARGAADFQRLTIGRVVTTGRSWGAYRWDP